MPMFSGHIVPSGDKSSISVENFMQPPSFAEFEGRGRVGNTETEENWERG